MVPTQRVHHAQDQAADVISDRLTATLQLLTLPACRVSTAREAINLLCVLYQRRARDSDALPARLPKTPGR